MVIINMEILYKEIDVNKDGAENSCMNNKILVSDENYVNDRLILDENELLFLKNKILNNSSIYITGCVMNCEKYLDNIYKIIKSIGKLFKDYKIIFSYDNSSDETLGKLEDLQREDNKIIILRNNNRMSTIRTENISNARNLIIEKIREINEDDYKYFIMMDMDDVCCKKFNINVLKKYIINDSRWDSLSFNRSYYYDIWALSYDPYVISCWHYYKTHNENRDFINNVIRPHFEKKINSLKNDELLDVYSAFGGFSIYKTDKFINSYYHWIAKDILELIPDNLSFNNVEQCDFVEPCILNNESKKIFDCEHRFFHLYAKKDSKVKIKVSPYFLFED